MKRLSTIFLIALIFSCSSKKQKKVEQTVNVYNNDDSIINSYITSLRINTNKGIKEYIYSNSKPTHSDVHVNVNDLFQVFSDSLAAFNYDTCRFLKITSSKNFETKEYKLLDYDTYISFNNEVGIIQIKTDFERTDFGTAYSNDLKK